MHWHEAKAKQLHSRMQGAYSHLRRSAYNTGSGSSPADDLDGIRIKPSLSTTSPTNQHAHTRSRSHEITLLENDMIVRVEHVDVRKEEREAQERERREKNEREGRLDALSWTQLPPRPEQWCFGRKWLKALFKILTGQFHTTYKYFDCPS